MFHQTLTLVCLIALANSTSAWFGVGERVEGDQPIFNQTIRSFETEFPTNHKVLMFFHGENTFTHVRFDVESVSLLFYNIFYKLNYLIIFNRLSMKFIFTELLMDLM